MKFKDWITYEFPSDEIIQGGSNSKYVERSGRIEGDIPQPHLIGVAPQSDLRVLINYLATFNSQNINQKLCHHGHIRHRPPHSEGLRRRIEAMQNIFKYNFVTFEGEPSLQNIVTFSQYLKNFLQHKFVFSAEGNGVDCHRHYEILLCKGIPILQEPNEQYCEERWGTPCYLKEKYRDLPVIFTNNFEGITKEFLARKYEEILNIDYNFDKLTMSFWKKISNIAEDCEYWKNMFNNK